MNIISEIEVNAASGFSGGEQYVDGRTAQPRHIFVGRTKPEMYFSRRIKKIPPWLLQFAYFKFGQKSGWDGVYAQFNALALGLCNPKVITVSEK